MYTNNEQTKIMNKALIQNGIITPDGTVLMVDGGRDYIRRNAMSPKEDLTLYDTDDFKKVREKLMRGTYGKNQDEDFRHVRLKDINDQWLEALIDYEQKNRPENIYLPYYIKEKEWRKLIHITHGTKKGIVQEKTLKIKK
jgi:hypothetical protein